VSVYRDITVSREDADHLLEIARFLRHLSNAADGLGPYGCWADDLVMVAHRYDRATKLADLRTEVLQFERARVGRPLVLIEGGDAA
jgi:hypothetical protein